MNIQSVNSTTNLIGCQPISQVEFAKRQSTVSETDNDSYTSSDNNNLEQKYDLACRVAAYYKTQYEQLLKSGKCYA